jgi:hypothetical protein
LLQVIALGQTKQTEWALTLRTNMADHLGKALLRRQGAGEEDDPLNITTKQIGNKGRNAVAAAKGEAGLVTAFAEPIEVNLTWSQGVDSLGPFAGAKG